MRCLLPVLLLTFPASAPAQPTSGLHDTGVVRFEVFDNGKLGAFYDGDDGTIGEGFVFGGEDALYEGAFLVGQDYDQVSGGVNDYPDLEWVTVEPVTVITPPPGFDEGYEAVYDDSGALNPIGLTVTQTTYASDGDPFVIADFRIENASGDDLEALYIGIFADWNVGAFEENYWDYDEFPRLLYVWDATDTNPNYYGIAAIDPPGDHYNVSAASGCAAGYNDAVLYGSLTVITNCGPAGTSDVRTSLGVGPFDIAAGETQRVLFAFLGGTDEDDILANAEAAQCRVKSECPTPSDPSTSPSGVTLRAPAPNPARGATTFSFTLDRPMPVHLSILDTLGREVAVLVDEARATGEQRVRWAPTGLPAGAYLVRLKAGDTRLSRPVVVSR